MLSGEITPKNNYYYYDMSFHYLRNDEMVIDRSTVVQIIVIKIPLFDCWCDNN